MASHQGWTKVSRKKGTATLPTSSAQHQLDTPSPTGISPQPSTLLPYSDKPTYAQVLGRKPKPTLVTAPKGKAPILPAPRSPNTSPPRSPRSPSPPPVHLIAAPNPSSPTKCRFPPSTHFEEWSGRCFRCFKRGHRSGKCTNAKRCTICLAEGHKFQNCPAKLQQPGPVFRPKKGSVDGKAAVLLDLLQPSEPRANDLMPPDDERPAEVNCHFTRDMAYCHELTRLQNSLVVTMPEDFDGEMSGEQVARTIISSGMVKTEELAITKIPRGKFIVLPPPHIEAATLANSIPDTEWSKGFQFEVWSPHINSTIEIPSFQVLLDIYGIPPLLWREEVVAHAVGSFAFFLGTVDHGRNGNLCEWKVIAATADLRNIPHKINFHVGGIKTAALIRVRRWVHVPLFEGKDLPPIPPAVIRPKDRAQATQITEEDEVITGPRWLLDKDHVVMSLTVMREILKDIDPARLPEDMRKALQGDREAIHASRVRANQEVSVICPAGSWSDRQLIHTGTEEFAGAHNLLKRQLQHTAVDETHLSDDRRSDKRTCTHAETQVLPSTLLSSSQSLLADLPQNLLFPEIHEFDNLNEAMSLSATPHMPILEHAAIPSTPLRMSHDSIGQRSPKKILTKGHTGKGALRVCPNSIKPTKVKKQIRQTKDLNNQVAVVDLDGFIEVPLTVVESFNVGDLVGFSAADVVKTVPNIEQQQITNKLGQQCRIQTRSVTASDFNPPCNAAKNEKRPKKAHVNSSSKDKMTMLHQSTKAQQDSQQMQLLTYNSGPQEQGRKENINSDPKEYAGSSKEVLEPIDENEPHIDLEPDSEEEYQDELE